MNHHSILTCHLCTVLVVYIQTVVCQIHKLQQSAANRIRTFYLSNKSVKYRNRAKASEARYYIYITVDLHTTCFSLEDNTTDFSQGFHLAKDAKIYSLDFPAV